VFFQRSSEKHNDIMLAAAIDRALAYGDAGADGEVANGWEMGL
jgi:2-methylisocitrate lyase-like PEP mutase family enzyme